jgi:hypothetical protein
LGINGVDFDAVFSFLLTILRLDPVALQ